MYKKFQKAFANILLSLTIVGTVSPILTSHHIYAEQNSQWNMQSESHIRDFYKKYNIDDTVTESLIAKIKRGESIDSLTGMNKSRGYTIKINNSIEHVQIYQDGSISVESISGNSISSIENMDTFRSYQPGTVVKSDHYSVTENGIKVFWTNGFITVGFYADCEYVNGGGSLKNVYGHFGMSMLGTLTIDSVNWTPNHNVVTLRYTYSVAGGFGTEIATMNAIFKSRSVEVRHHAFI